VHPAPRLQLEDGKPVTTGDKRAVLMSNYTVIFQSREVVEFSRAEILASCFKQRVQDDAIVGMRCARLLHCGCFVTWYAGASLRPSRNLHCKLTSLYIYNYIVQRRFIQANIPGMRGDLGER
jgi:hypothetical protein